jgi:hypothetical protein
MRLLLLRVVRTPPRPQGFASPENRATQKGTAGQAGAAVPFCRHGGCHVKQEPFQAQAGA